MTTETVANFSNGMLPTLDCSLLLDEGQSLEVAIVMYDCYEKPLVSKYSIISAFACVLIINSSSVLPVSHYGFSTFLGCILGNFWVLWIRVTIGVTLKLLCCYFWVNLEVLWNYFCLILF